MESFAVTKFNEPLQCLRRPLPNLTASQVLLRTLAAGVCHSDAHLWEGSLDLGGGQKQPLNFPLPAVFGHENVGEVVAVGPNAKSLRPGMKVLVYPWFSLEDPAYPAGAFLGAGAFDGGFASHIVVPDEKFCVDVAGLPEEEVCLLACSGITAYGALKKAIPYVQSGAKHVFIIGAGGVGLQAVRLCKHVLGVAPIVCDVSQKALDAAKQLGGSDVVTVATDPQDPNATIGACVKASNGEGADVVIDFVGKEATADLGLKILAAKTRNNTTGLYVLVGLGGGLLSFPLPMLLFRKIDIKPSFVGTLQDVKELIEFTKADKLQKPLVTTRALNVDEANNALQGLLKGGLTGRTVLVAAKPKL